MKHLLAALACGISPSFAAQSERVVLAIHGGLGDYRAETDPEEDKARVRDMEWALKAGYAALNKKGGRHLDAIETAIRVLEDSPYFNAGKGSRFTQSGRFELDASIMEGRELKAGAVAGVATVKNPITAARAVMERSRHVLFAGPGADAFAKTAGLELVEQDYFWTEKTRKAYQERLKKTGQKTELGRPRGHHWGTVGAVALDKDGKHAAGTSTGGYPGKTDGRVGDSPIIGAGTYADNAACAVSGTGHGEYFIRYGIARDVASLMKYKGLSAEDAASEVILGKLKVEGKHPEEKDGGVILLTPQGRFVSVFNSYPVRRGTITDKGEVRVFLYED